MRRPYQILMPLLSLFLVRVDLTDVWPLIVEVHSPQFTDADTIIVRRNAWKFNVRIAGIDAPEKGQPFANSSMNAGKVALECAKRVLSRQKGLNLKIFKQDLYGRYLGDLDGLALKLIRKGCASLYPFGEFESFSDKWEFLRAQTQSRRLKLGLWKWGGYRQPKIWRSSRRSAGRPLHR